MRPLPEGWPSVDGDRPRRGFWAPWRRADRARRLRRLQRWARVWGLPLGTGFAAVCVALATQPWPPLMTGQARPGGAELRRAARAVGLAPARRGQPGYWPQHDRDRDGVACEPWRRGR